METKITAYREPIEGGTQSTSRYIPTRVGPLEVTECNDGKQQRVPTWQSVSRIVKRVSSSGDIGEETKIAAYRELFEVGI